MVSLLRLNEGSARDPQIRRCNTALLSVTRSSLAGSRLQLELAPHSRPDDASDDVLH